MSQSINSTQVREWKITKDEEDDSKRHIEFNGRLISDGDLILEASDNLYKIGIRQYHNIEYWIRTLRTRGYTVEKIDAINYGPTQDSNFIRGNIESEIQIIKEAIDRISVYLAGMK